MNISDFMGNNLSFLNGLTENPESVRYAVKVSKAVLRRTQNSSGGMFSGVMSGIGNLVSDTISSAIYDSYFIGIDGGKIGFVSEKNNTVVFTPQEVGINFNISDGNIDVNVDFPSGSMQNAAFGLSEDKLEEVFWGNMSELLKDFDRRGEMFCVNISNTYASVNMSKCTQNTEKPYEVAAFLKGDTLISYDKEYIYLNNMMKKIPFKDILACNTLPQCYSLIVKNGKELCLCEIFRNGNNSEKSGELNLIAESETEESPRINIEIPETVKSAKYFLSLWKKDDFEMMILDSDAYFSDGNDWICGGMFVFGETIYVKLQSGTVVKYEKMMSVIDVLKFLPMRYDTIFLEENKKQPCLADGDIHYIDAKEKILQIDGEVFEYKDILEFSYSAKDYCCEISFSKNNEKIRFVTAESLGIHISRSCERASICNEIQDFSINKLYSRNFKNETKCFVAETFAEIFKTNKLLNMDITVDDLLDVMESDESAVLRNALLSVVGKFKNIDDLQEQLIQKLAILEISRRKIQKMLDEWALFYPHYAASKRIEWLKKNFSLHIKEDVLQNEYWNCVYHFKRLFGGMNASISKILSEIALCINRLSEAMPDSVRRANIPSMMRVSPRSKTSAAKAGSNALLALGTGAELANFFVRGFSASSPMMISMSVKMMVDSYIKDAKLRNDIKTFGTQALEWWQILMKDLAIHIAELTKGFNDYSKARLKCDTAVFTKIQNTDSENIKKRLFENLRGEILKGIDEKYLEIMPQLNMRISNVLDDVKFSSDFCPEIVKEFEENIYV